MISGACTLCREDFFGPIDMSDSIYMNQIMFKVIRNFMIFSFIFQTQEMIKEIIKAFQERIKKHSWIDKKTRKGILEKV